MIRSAEVADAGSVAGIYNYYIENTVVTFEEKTLAARDMAQRIDHVLAQGLPFLVAQDSQGRIVGYAYASRWNGRCSYRYSVEVTVYLAPDTSGQGWGSRLYQVLFEQLREQSMHVLIAGIALPNPGSVALHEKFGMQKVAHFAEVGYKHGQWLDVGYWQRTFDPG